MSLETGMALFFSAGAVCTDLFLEKVPNRWIVLGLAAGAVCQGLLHGAGGIPFYSEVVSIFFSEMCLL